MRRIVMRMVQKSKTKEPPIGSDNVPKMAFVPHLLRKLGHCSIAVFDASILQRYPSAWWASHLIMIAITYLQFYQRQFSYKLCLSYLQRRYIYTVHPRNPKVQRVPAFAPICVFSTCNLSFIKYATEKLGHFCFWSPTFTLRSVAPHSMNRSYHL